MLDTPLQFLGTRKELAKIHIKSIFLMIITLGIYRFWYKTNIRRFLWNKITFNNDERFEYTGTGLELLKGFAIALLIIVPLNISISLASLTSFQFTVIGVAVLIGTFLGYFALYAARRYLLTRTLWRGLRFRLEGSAWAFAIKAFLWFFAIVLTLGLINPWASAWFERNIMNNTRYGSAHAGFHGTGLGLFKKLLPFTLLSFGQLMLMGYIFFRLADLGEIADLWAALNTGDNEILAEAYADTSKNTLKALHSLWIGFSVWIMLSLLVYPATKAIYFKWFASNLTLGEASFTSNFRIWQAYKIYLKAFLLLIGTTFVLGLLGGLVSVLFYKDITLLFEEYSAYFFVFGAVFYFLLIILFVLYQALYITFPFWREMVNSITATNLASLDDVVANNQNVSAFGESLADGATDLGF